MIKALTIALPAAIVGEEQKLKQAVADELGIAAARISGIRQLRRSLDARSRQVKCNLLLEAFVDEPFQPQNLRPFHWKDVHQAPGVLIVGAGPAGLFAALRLIESGLKPIVIERGKDVRSRRRDLAAMNKQGIVNPESNYCFGEGGAGTYSDGKLYTRSTKRGDVKRILELLVAFGADPEILIEAHPHIGTNKLPGIITAIREHVLSCGGQILFDHRLEGILLENGSVQGIRTSNGVIEGRELILATGHSARDVFRLLHDAGIRVEAKPFALGVRIEHPQYIVDQAQYRMPNRPEYLPPASYSLVTQQEGRGVFSFCMCPGGIIAPAATAPGEIVVNGWSPSKRNNPFANSGTVVTVDEFDFANAGFEGPLAGMHFQELIEQTAFLKGGGGLVAPAQRLTDFVKHRVSDSLPECSYLPGVSSSDLHAVFPAKVRQALSKAVQEFGKKMPGYYTSEALMVATESRTSSPVRIPRDPETLEHPEVSGLFPCAEGAGYAGGIVSAAIDGERCAAQVLARHGRD